MLSKKNLIHCIAVATLGVSSVSFGNGQLTGFYAQLNGSVDQLNSQNKVSYGNPTDINDPTFNLSNFGGTSNAGGIGLSAGYHLKVGSNWELGTGLSYTYFPNLKIDSTFHGSIYGMKLSEENKQTMQSLKELDFSIGHYFNNKKVLALLSFGPTWADINSNFEYQTGTKDKPKDRSSYQSKSSHWTTTGHIALGLDISLAKHQYVGLSTSYTYLPKFDNYTHTSTGHTADVNFAPDIFSAVLSYGVMF